MMRRSAADLLTSSLSPPPNAFAAQHVTEVHVLSAALMLRYVYRVPRRLRMMGTGSLVFMTLEPWQLGLGSGSASAHYSTLAAGGVHWKRDVNIVLLGPKGEQRRHRVYPCYY